MLFMTCLHRVITLQADDMFAYAPKCLQFSQQAMCQMPYRGVYREDWPCLAAWVNIGVAAAATLVQLMLVHQPLPVAAVGDSCVPADALYSRGGHHLATLATAAFMQQQHPCSSDAVQAEAAQHSKVSWSSIAWRCVIVHSPYNSVHLQQQLRAS